jgi:hypothetical protein
MTIMATTRYFAVQPDQCKDFKAIFVPDSDLRPVALRWEADQGAISLNLERI